MQTGDRDKPEEWVLVGAAWPGANNTMSIRLNAEPAYTGVFRGKLVLQERISQDSRRQSRQDDRGRR